MPPAPATPAPAPDRARHPVIVVTGPTASGKTAIAIEIAQRFGGEIVNADSMQVYRFMDIGTAKPTIEQRAAAPHHVFDVVTPEVDYSAGRYVADARAAAADIHGRGHPVVLTGGTGLYIRSFLYGLIETGAHDADRRAQLEREHERAVETGDPLRLHRRLAEQDPQAAARIHPNDSRRTIRALEIAMLSGRRASAVRDEHAFGDCPYAVLHLAIDPGREIVNERIDRRCVRMIEGGLLQEVRALRERGYGPELRSMKAIGYRHLQPVVEGEDTLANALVAMQRDTRQFARRQRTWLRAVSEVAWTSDASGDEALRASERLLEELDRGETPDTAARSARALIGSGAAA